MKLRDLFLMVSGGLCGWYLCEVAIMKLNRPSFLLVAVVLILVAPKGRGK